MWSLFGIIMRLCVFIKPAVAIDDACISEVNFMEWIFFQLGIHSEGRVLGAHIYRHMCKKTMELLTYKPTLSFKE